MLQQNRSHGLDSLDILQSRRLLSDGLSYIEMSLQLAGNEKSLFLALGMYMLHAYTMLNLRVNFQDQILIPINQIEQYTIRNQNNVLFHLNFGRFTQEQAVHIFRLLNLALSMKTENGYVISSETGFLIFLK